MDVNNLTNVYNQNPTLQGSYTLPEYLALFGQGGTSTPDPTPTPTPDPGQGIINANINQFQNQGGDGPQGDFGIFGNLDKNTAKDFNVQTYDEEYGDFIDTKITGYKNVNSGLYQDKFGKNLQPAFSNKGKTPGFLGVGMQLLGLSPKTVGGYVPGSIRGKYDGPTEMFKKTKKFIGDKVNFTKTGNLAIEKEKERVRQEEAARAEAVRVANVQSSLDSGSYVSRDSSGMSSSDRAVGGGAGVAGLGSSATDRGSKSAQGYSQHAKGGRVGYNDGGSTNGSGEAALSAKVKELMDDGYEFGEAVKEAMKQGYMNGGRIKSYFKGGIAGFKNGGRINFRGGGSYQGGRSSSSSSSSSSSKSSGPAGGASAGGNYGGNRNPNQTYGGGGGGGGGGPKPGSGRVNIPNRSVPKNLSFFDKVNIHSANNAKLEKAYRDKVIDSDEYNVLGGLSSKRDLGFGPIRTAAASTAYNLVQSALGPKFTRGNQPLFDGASDVGRNTFGSNLEPDSALAKQYDEIMKTYKKGGRVRSYFKGGLVSLRGR